MARKSDISQMTQEELEAGLSVEQKEFLQKVRTGKKDPVYFAYTMLGIELHDAQKLWLWMTTKTQPDLAFEAGLRLEKWKTREEFEEVGEDVGHVGQALVVLLLQDRGAGAAAAYYGDAVRHAESLPPFESVSGVVRVYFGYFVFEVHLPHTGEWGDGVEGE